MGDDFKLQSHANILAFRGLFISFVVWCISMFFNIVSTIRSLREEELIDEEHLLTNENCFFNPSEYLVLYFIFLARVAMLKSSKEYFAEDEVTI